MANEKLVGLLKAVSAAYQIKDEKANRFRIIAYDRAAAAIEHLTSEIKDLWDDNKLNTIPSVGSGIAQHLDELFRTGKVKHFNQVLSALPPAMFEFLNIRGIGAKTAYKLCRKIGIISVKNALGRLKKAAEQNKIGKLPGFGENSEARILKSIEEYEKTGEKKKRMLLPCAHSLAKEILEYLLNSPNAKKADLLGSLRRQTATVGDVDIAVNSSKPREIIDLFIEFPKVKRVLESGEKGATVLLNSGHEINLRVQSSASYGALLQHYTGSKHHNIHLRKLANKNGCSLSEYGIREIKAKKLHKFKDEASFYQFLGLDWIPPELREDNGEIEAAQKQQLPNLISLGDIKGDLHIHSDFNTEPSHDLGKDSMNDIVKKCVKLGYRFLAFAEHNPSFSRHSEKETISILKRKRDYVRQRAIYWKKEFNINVLNSLEINIKPDGSLAMPEKGFKYLDFAIVSIHTVFNLSREKMTRRIIKALNHPKVKILAHPTGRKIGQRESYEVDWDKLFDFCKKRNKILEINSCPNRLDLPDVLIKEAVRNGVKVTVNSDAHAFDQLDFMKYGVSNARRGWAEAKDIINTFSFKKLSKILGVD